MNRCDHMLYKPVITVFLVLIGSISAIGQDTLKITGTVSEASSGAVPYRAMIIDQGKGVGIFPDQSGKFEMYILRKDSIVVTAPGYRPMRYAFVDSTGTTFSLYVTLHKLEIELSEHVVMPKRELEEVHEDLKEVELKLPDRPSGVSALSSPISAIYARFSRMERSKRLVAQMEYQDKKNDLLKELFKIYVDADILTLSPDEFDKFIYYCNPSDHFLRTATEYELIQFFKTKFASYIERKR